MVEAIIFIVSTSALITNVISFNKINSLKKDADVLKDYCVRINAALDKDHFKDLKSLNDSLKKVDARLLKLLDKNYKNQDK